MAEPLRKIRTDTHDSSRTASSTSSRYNLHEDNKSPILVYEVRGGLTTSSESDLVHRLDTEEKYARCRVTKKSIPRFHAVIDVKRHDLYLEHEKELYSDYPNYDTSLATIKLPSSVYWSNVFMGTYEELYILSPETSPNNSDAGSRKISPSSTFSHHDVEGGAEKDGD